MNGTLNIDPQLSKVDRTTDVRQQLPTREEAVEAASKFEAIFVGMLVKDLRESSSAFGEGLFGKDVGAGVHEGIFDTMMSERLAESGRIGLADHLVKDWESKGRIAKATVEKKPREIIETEDRIDVAPLEVDPRLRSLEMPATPTGPRIRSL